jgi:hypothetical protein
MKSGFCMKSERKIFSAILIALYLIFPGNGLAFANHFFHDRGLPVIDCSCCTEKEKNTTDHSFPGSEDVNDTLEHACSCACHLPSRVLSAISPDVFSMLLPGDAQKYCPEIYLPIFVPPQNLV